MTLNLRHRNQLTQIPKAFSENMEGEWDFMGENTQKLTHGLHPYLASMIPQIPSKLLAMYADSETRILEPFMGGGSVLVEAHFKNIESTGIDINPLAVIISKAKTTPIPNELLSKVLQIFDEVYMQVEPVVPAFPKSYQISYWFKPYMFEPLARIRTAIEEVTNHIGCDYHTNLKNLLNCIFSNTVRDVSLTYRSEIKLRKLQGEDLKRFNPDVTLEFKKRMEEAFLKVNCLPLENKIPHIYEGDARSIPAENNQFELVITSPPYGDLRNTVPYDQFSRNMLYWLGFDESVLNKIRQGCLGAKNGQKTPPSSETLQQALEEMQTPKLIDKAICFYQDYFDAMVEIARVTSQRIIIIVGHRVLNAVLIDTPMITIEIMRQLGWRLETKYKRTIRGKRINRKIAFGNNAKGGTIDSESILVFVPKRYS